MLKNWQQNTPKTITKTNNTNKTHGWTPETYVQLVNSCTYADPTSKVDKLVTCYERLTRLDNPVSEGMCAYSIRDPRMKPKVANKTFTTPQEARDAYLARKAKETRNDAYKQPTMFIPTAVPVVATPAPAVNNLLTKSFSEDGLMNMLISELKEHLFGSEDPKVKTEDTVPDTEKIPPNLN